MSGTTSKKLETALNTSEGQDRYLLGGIAQAAFRKGNMPGPNQVLMFTIPPLLGGPLTSDNVGVYDLVVALAILSQLHRQIKDLPPESGISGFSVDGSVP